MTEAHTLAVTSDVPATTAIDLYTGWNLAGYPNAANGALPAVLRGYGWGIDFSLVYVYHADDSSDPWKLFDRTAGGGYVPDLTVLAPGWGYWVV